MPRTVSSDVSHFNLSASNSQEAARAGTKKKKKRIDKRKLLHPPQSRRVLPKQKNILLSRKLCRKLVYSPEYTININEASTPLYHSDEYSPSIDSTPTGKEERVRFEQYITMDLLMRMVKEREDERQEKQLVRQMRQIKISALEEEIAME